MDVELHRVEQTWLSCLESLDKAAAWDVASDGVTSACQRSGVCKILIGIINDLKLHTAVTSIHACEVDRRLLSAVIAHFIATNMPPIFAV